MLTERSQILSKLFASANRWQAVFFGVVHKEHDDEVRGRVASKWPTDAALRMVEQGFLSFPAEHTFAAPHLRTLVAWPGLDVALIIVLNKYLVNSPAIKRIDLLWTRTCWMRFRSFLVLILPGLQESCRLHAIFSTLAREAGEDDVISLSFPVQTQSGALIYSITVRKGQSVGISICAYNR